MSEPITIVMTTYLPPEREYSYRRLGVMGQALESWSRHLRYAGPLHLHVADDGSSEAWLADIRMVVEDSWPGSVTYTQQPRRGVGASLNAGLAQAFARGDIALHAVDDWELLAPLNLNQWAEFLRDPNYDVGMVRFFPHPDLTGTVRHIPPHGWAMALDRHHFVFGFRPCLWHRRFFEALGPFLEGVSSFDAEEDFNRRATAAGGPKFEGERIWLALPELWRPLEAGSLAALMPSG